MRISDWSSDVCSSDLLSANSSASDLVSVIRPPFDDEYCDMPFEPVCADDDEMLMTRPQPALSMSGIAACVSRNGPIRLMRYMRSIASCVTSRNAPNAVDRKSVV